MKGRAHVANALDQPQVWAALKLKMREFFFKPATARPLAAVRIGITALLLIQAVVLRDWMFPFLSSDGFIQKPVADALWTSALPNIPNITWLMQWLLPFSEPTSIVIVSVSYLISLIFLASGLYTRLFSVLTWFFHWTIYNSAFTLHYGVDMYAHVFLFYLMFTRSGDCWSVDAWRRSEPAEPSAVNRLGLRAMQIQLAMSYLATGLWKAQSEQWWNGDLIWRALTLPLYQHFDFTRLGHWPFFFIFAGWMTLLFEIGYIIFIWPRFTRWIWIAGIMGMHVGIALFLGLEFFGVIMCILTGALFGISPEPGQILAEGVPSAPFAMWTKARNGS